MLCVAFCNIPKSIILFIEKYFSFLESYRDGGNIYSKAQKIVKLSNTISTHCDF